MNLNLSLTEEQKEALIKEEQRIIHREWRKANPDRAKAWRRAHPEKVREYNRRYLLKRALKRWEKENKNT